MEEEDELEQELAVRTTGCIPSAICVTPPCRLDTVGTLAMERPNSCGTVDRHWIGASPGEMLSITPSGVGLATAPWATSAARR